MSVPGLLLATTQLAMGAVLATPWKVYMTGFMVLLVVKWVTLPLLVGDFALAEYLSNA